MFDDLQRDHSYFPNIPHPHRAFFQTKGSEVFPNLSEVILRSDTGYSEISFVLLNVIILTGKFLLIKRYRPADTDRLDLGRVGIYPSSAFMSYEAE